MRAEHALVGRRAELDEIVGLLAAARLLTLTGPGGAGKTRLALAAAERVAAGSDGPAVLVVELAGVRSGERVTGAVLDAAGVRESPGRERTETLLEHLGDRDALVVLDNCEHLAAAAGEVAEVLLRRSAQVRVLATSRGPLEVAGEVTWRAPPLSLPEADTPAAVLASDAGRLFAERAREAASAFAVDEQVAADVARLCRELDGSPLALELAAAQASAQSVSEILRGVSDLPRQKAVQASVEWSYRLLDEPAQAALRRLSLFAGWTASDAAVVDVSPAALATLVRAALVTRDGDACAMTEPVRAFALERLEASPAEAHAARASHLAHYCDLARRADELVDDAGGAQRLERDGPNVLATLELALDDGDARALEIVAGLGLWWLMTDRFTDGRASCARALAAVAEPEPRVEALARWGSALLALHSLDYPDAHAQGSRALALAEASGDPRAIGRCLMMMSVVLGATDPLEGARMGRRAVELLRVAGDRHGLAHALIALATAEGQCDRFDAARAACSEFDALGAGRAHTWLRAWMHITLAWADDFEGHEERSLAQTDLALGLAGGDPSLTRRIALCNRVAALARSGAADQARAIGLAELAAAADATEAGAAGLAGYVAIAELALGDLDSAEARMGALCDERHLPMAAGAHELLARVALARADTDAAEEHIGALRRIAVRTESARRAGLAELFEGIATVQRASPARAGEHLHAALVGFLEHGFQRDAIDALEALGALAALESDARACGRLLAAAAAARRELGCVRGPPDEPWLAHLRERARAELGADGWRTAWTEGESLTLDVAASLAARGRGKRLRPLGGWESLTPTEAEVALLAAQGLSNPQIGERMFISRGTVKAHLAHVYAKLGIANRTELATLAARREPSRT